MTKKRILFISTIMPGEPTGGSRRTWQLLDFFRKIGEVTYFFYDKELRCFTNREQNFPVSISTFNLWPFSLRKYYSPELMEFIHSREADFEILAVDHSHLLYLFQGVKIMKVADFQNCEELLLMEQARQTKNPLFFLESMLFRKYLKKFVQLADLIFTPSLVELELISKDHPRVAYLPHSYSNRIRPERVGERMLILFGNYGYFATFSGSMELLNVYKKARKTRNLPDLYIIGNKASRLFKTEANIRVKDMIIYLDDLLGVSDIFLIPVGYGAGSRVKLIDSLAAGLPFISTEKGVEGYHASVRECGIVVQRISDFPGAVEVLTEEKYRLCKEAILKVREQYSYKFVFENYFLKAFGKDAL
ncbi:MAG: glycosyltransferase [Candidatus Wallbacteria bacterium]|nr:glycosyltransferase [Candidatus Wallbacteria bacterium]